ncbi:DUF6311 domain-containing protein [Sphingomonas floccifaciens]|uniref:DUF6311 domain-containing protein n=1 Tax=Sphingomonas floccifaciens TaxID=1844115 RepID=A0ABW4NAL1_9SPHN
MSAVSRLPLILLPLALFAWFFHPAMLDPTNIGWILRGTDNGEGALGLHAWLHGGHGFLRTGLLNAPEGVSLLFTDSNPLVALLLTPFAGLLPADFQMVGPWILFCLVLHVAFARALLKDYAPDTATLWIGVALLSLLPTLYARYVHWNLMPHWLILWALWLFVSPRRASNLQAWGLLMLGAVLIHSYLLVMVAAIWASAMLERFATAPSPRDRLRIVIGALVIAAMTAGIALALGAGGSYAPTNTYGFFAMPLDALWNPATDSYSVFLPATTQRDGRDFEGFQYLGLGLLILLPLALAVAGRTKPRAEEAGVLRRLLWLAPALAVLTLVAVSNWPHFAGSPVGKLPLPTFLAPITDMVRASGRLFWPTAYTLVFAGIVALYRLSLPRARLLLAALLAVQFFDMLGMHIAIGGFHAREVAHSVYEKTPDPRWDTLIAGARDIAFEPADVTLDLQRFQEIAWRAVKAGKPVRSLYAARTPVETQLRQARESAAFQRGERVAGRMYVLIAGAKPPAGMPAVAIDGVYVVPAVSVR